MINSYRDLIVWQSANTMIKRMYALADSIPPSERYGMIQQLKRAALSVALNIAEGKQRTTRKEYARFIDMSIGSLNEVEAILSIAVNLQFLDDDTLQDDFREISCLRKRLFALRAKLRIES